MLCGWPYLFKPCFFRAKQRLQRPRIQDTERLECKHHPHYPGLCLHLCPWGCSSWMLCRLLSPSMELRLFKLTRHLRAKAVKTNTHTHTKPEVPRTVHGKSSRSSKWPLFPLTFKSQSVDDPSLRVCSPSGVQPLPRLSESFWVTAPAVGCLGNALYVEGKAIQYLGSRTVFLPPTPKLYPKAKHSICL